MSAILDEIGHKKIILRSDQEPAILALKAEVINRLIGYEAIPQESPVGDHQSNGDIENTVRELGNKYVISQVV